MTFGSETPASFVATAGAAREGSAAEARAEADDVNAAVAHLPSAFIEARKRVEAILRFCSELRSDAWTSVRSMIDSI